MGTSGVGAAAFRRDGHALIRGAIDTRCIVRARRAAGREMRRALHDLPSGSRPAPNAPYQTIARLWERHRHLRALVCAPRLGQIAATLMGVERVRLLYDELFVKPSGASLTMWHQDQVHWPIVAGDASDDGAAPGDRPIDAVRIWISLTNLPAEVGGLHFVDGSHHRGAIDVSGFSGGAPGHRSTFSFHGDEHPVRDYGHMAAGDATVHAGYTVHAARRNTSGAPRFGVAVAYVADGARLAEPVGEGHRAFMEQFIPNRRPGDRIDTARNPVLWEARR